MEDSKQPEPRMSPVNEFSMDPGERAVMLLTVGHSGGKGVISRIEVLESRDIEQKKDYDEYRDDARKEIRRIESELNGRLSAFQASMMVELKELRMEDAKSEKEHQDKMMSYMKGGLALLITILGTMIVEMMKK